MSKSYSFVRLSLILPPLANRIRSSNVRFSNRAGIERFISWNEIQDEDEQIEASKQIDSHACFRPILGLYDIIVTHDFGWWFRNQFRTIIDAALLGLFFSHTRWFNQSSCITDWVEEYGKSNSGNLYVSSYTGCIDFDEGTQRRKWFLVISFRDK